MSDATVQQDQAERAGGGCGCGGCGCGAGESDSPSAGLQIGSAPPAGGVEPGDMDLRPLPPAQRHAQVLEAVGSLLPGEGFVLAVDHDPVRLRQEVESQESGTIGWRHLTEGPGLWRVLVSRETCC